MKSFNINCSVFMLLICVSSLIMACSENKGQSEIDTFEIQGKVLKLDDRLPATGTKIWLVPFYGPHPRPVDSCFVLEDGSFHFEGNNELMAIIRLGMTARYGYQDLLICTEHGKTDVTIGEISSCKGTPLNNALQTWKDYRESYLTNLYGYSDAFKHGIIDSTEYTTETNQLNADAGNFVYDFLMKLGSNVLTRCLNTMKFGNISEEHRVELDELLRDTIDYSKPQPGFHL